MIQELLANDVFAGVLGAGAIGAVAYQARSWGRVLWDALLRRFTCELTVRKGDCAFTYVNEWLARQPESKVSRRLLLSDSHGGEWAMSLGEGNHWLLRRRMLISLSMEEGGQLLIPRQTLRIRTLGASQARLRQVVREAMAISKDQGRTVVHSWHDRNGGYWSSLGSEKSRPTSTVYLPDGQVERIVADARWFLASEDLYAQRGVPWRRGYLFHGPPGTGKSSMAFALAGALEASIYMVSLNAVSNDAALMECVSTVPRGSVLLLEDVDAAFTRGRDKEDPGISMSGLLNALDGVAAGSGRLLIMTTNHPDRLDPALVRPGRADLREEFGEIGLEEVDRMLQAFFPGTHLAWPEGASMQPARLQEILMSSASPDEAVKRLNEELP